MFAGSGVGVGSDVFVGSVMNVLVGLASSVWVIEVFISASEGLHPESNVAISQVRSNIF